MTGLSKNETQVVENFVDVGKLDMIFISKSSSIFSVKNSTFDFLAPLKRVRYLTTFLITLAVTVAFSMRVTLSIAIVGMTNEDTNPDFETFDWDADTKSTVLSSFFWG